MDIQVYLPENLRKWHRIQIVLWKTKQFFTNLAWPLLWRNLFLICICLIFVYLILNLLAGARWIDQPYAGFLHQNRVVTENNFLVTPSHNLTDDTDLALPQTVLINKDSIIAAVEQQQVLSSAWLIDYLRQREGELVEYTLLGKDGYHTSVKVPVIVFTWQNFIQIVGVPALIGILILITAGTIIYVGYELFLVRLFALFCLLLGIHLVSFPSLAAAQLATVSLMLALVSKIVLPSLLLHLLLLLYRPRKLLKDWPFLLPLIYLPVVPSLIHLPQLFDNPMAHRNLAAVIDAYTLVYTGGSLIVLLAMILKSKFLYFRTQALVLILGLILPTFLLLINTYLTSNAQAQRLFTAADRYWFAGIPFAVVWLAARNKGFGFKVARRTYLLYLRTMLIGVLAYICLITLLNPPLSHFELVQWQDIPIILISVAIFFVARFLYSNLHSLTTDLIYGNIDEFRNGYRIVSRNLLKVESRHDLERLIGLDLPSDFRLRNAEITAKDRKSNIRYTLAFPLTLNNLNIGNLYLGGKINGKSFTTKELEILNELKKQISLAVWSFELDKNIHKVEELTRLKSRFLAHVTHELRTPLNGIINYIGFVLDDYYDHLNQEQIDHLERALHSAESLLHIINNILDMSKIEAGQMTLYRQPVDLTGLINEITPIIRQKIEAKPIEFITNIAPDLPKVRVDRLRMRQILLNLLTNAAKFTQTGQIGLQIWLDANHITITVTDTGPGIEAQLIPTIFQQFTSAGLMDADQNLGLGLSMPITKALIELHGGQIDLMSQPGQGTKFTVALPRVLS